MPPLTEAPPAPPRPVRHLPWRGPAVLLALVTGIALLLTTLSRGPFVERFVPHFVYSACIGAGCWLCIDGGRWLIAQAMLRWRRARGRPVSERDRRWPGWGGMSVALLFGVPGGVSLGMVLADRLTGQRSHGLLDWASPGARVTLVIAVLATAVMVALMSAMERAALARVEAAKARGATEAAQRAAAEHRLRLLESQLEPHMLFNTLANLRALIAVDPPRAQAMLDRLIGYLRATLGASRTSMHPLADEFARLDDYLSLMAVRMGPRLAVQLDLPAALRERPVPALLLQPLVENAIQHGLEPEVEGGRVAVQARVEGGRLVLSVRDSGVGLRGGTGGGFGCTQVRERLATLYGDAARLRIEPAPEGGTLATVELP